MTEGSQIVVPEAFIALFRPGNAVKTTEPREVIAVRHELCEDMAQMLMETERSMLFDLGIAESDVLDQVQRGLRVDGSVVSPTEAWWVTGRLAELLDWPLPTAMA